MSPRVQWIDSSRGVAILLVVLMHVTVTTYSPVTADDASATSWNSLVNAGWPAHLTVFFLLAGMLNSAAVRTGLGSRKVRRSVWLYLWVYVLWQTIYTLLTAAGVDVWTPNMFTQKKATLLQFVAPYTVLWFLLALAIWTVIVAALYRMRPQIVIAILAVVSVCSWFMHGVRGHDQYMHIMQYGLYFAIGVYGAKTIRTMIEQHTLTTLTVSIVGYSIGAFTVALPAAWAMPIGSILWYLGAAGVLMSLCKIAEPASALTRPLTWIGQRTIPLYVLHLPVAIALTLLPFWANVANAPIVGPATPILVTGSAILVAFVLEFALRKTWGRYLWEAPPLRLLRDPTSIAGATSFHIERR